MIALALFVAACEKSSVPNQTGPKAEKSQAILTHTLTGKAAIATVDGVEDPEAFVRSIYRSYAAGKAVGLPHQPLTPRLRRLLETQDLVTEGEVGSFDFDPWVNGQDFELGPVMIKAQAIGQSQQVVTAQFTNFGEANTISVEFEQLQDRWHLSDIRSKGTAADPAGWTLSQLLFVQNSEVSDVFVNF